MEQQKTAALLIIGNEILSGRTQDANLNHLAKKLNDKGIVFAEARVVRDVEAAIIEAVNALRARYDYVFTSGGIGPTHDDITIASIAAAFGVAVVEDAGAYQRLVDHYGGAEHITPARRRMALVPDGARLIDNPVSGAPGVAIDNVFIMAGVPKIMQAMLDAVLPELVGGPAMIAESVTFDIAESKLADPLAAIQKRHPDVDIGSYPQYRSEGPRVMVVIRGTDAGKVEEAKREVVGLSVAPTGLEPVHPKANDFKSFVSTNSTTGPCDAG